MTETTTETGFREGFLMRSVIVLFIAAGCTAQTPISGSGGDAPPPAQQTSCLDSGGTCTVAGPVSIAGTVPVSIADPVTVKGSVSIDGDVKVAQPLTVQGEVSVHQPIEILDGVKVITASEDPAQMVSFSFNYRASPGQDCRDSASDPLLAGGCMKVPLDGPLFITEASGVIYYGDGSQLVTGNWPGSLGVAAGVRHFLPAGAQLWCFAGCSIAGFRPYSP